MFTEPKTTLHGKHYHVTDAIGLPKPVQKPHPPIMIGGTGEKVLLRIVARHADMWNASAGAERMRHLIGVIERHADKAKRDADRIEKTVMIPLAYNAPEPRQQFMCQLIANMRQTTPEEARKGMMIGDKQECLDTIERYAKVGVTHFIFMVFAPYFVDEIQGFAEDVMPAARG
jgi:alkanesulfonate monooxygenase SsuD/methylene tetrahydromethanopterin reductase-like flavin-dependent oxidoreductase (luciferase family)